MMYNMKYFEENKIEVPSTWSKIYDLPDINNQTLHRIAICACERCARYQYYNVCVDGKTIATRTKQSNAIRIALNYLNEQQ